MGKDAGDLAGYLPRVGATLLDGVIIGVLAAVVAIVLGGTGASDDLIGWVVIGAALLTGLVYAPPLMARSGKRNGQTLGKQVLHVRVVRQDAEPVTFGQAVLREFLGKGLLGLIPFYTVVDYLFPLGDRRRQAIHDKLASTFVVREDAVPDLGAWDGDGTATPVDPFGREALDRPEAPSGWEPPRAAGAPEPERADWGPPVPGPTPPPDPPRTGEDDEPRGPFGP